MDEERTTLSDDEILTTGMGETHRSAVMDSDGGDDDADVDTDDSDSDADTDDAG